MTDLRAETFLLDVSGRPVHGVVEWSAEEEASRPFAILAHGFRSSHTRGFLPLLAERLAHAGFVSVRFSMSGSGMAADGRTFERPDLFARDTYGKQLEDLAAVREHVISGAFPADPTRGAVFGHSRGSGIALVHAAEVEGLRMVVGWATIVQAASWTEAKKKRWRERGTHRIAGPDGEPIELELDVLDDADANRERYDMAAVAARTKTPALLVHGTDDEGVPLTEIRALYRHFPPGVARLVEIGGAGHNFGARSKLRTVPRELESAIGVTVAALVSACRSDS